LIVKKVPLILKGVQTWEDALEAYDQNLAGVVLSNHGGRQLDFARSGIEVLVEVVEKFKEKRGITFPNDRFQLFVDGGVRRATDVLKAIALGATAGAYIKAVGNASEKMDTLKFSFQWG
jgi:L-lactate dehydrogenase (cytochrome)